MFKNKSLFTISVPPILIIFLISAPVSAQRVKWCIEGAKFSDQSALTGFFEYDVSQTSVGAFHIETVSAEGFRATSYTSELGKVTADTRNSQLNNALNFYPDKDDANNGGEPRLRLATTIEGQPLLSLLADSALNEIPLTSDSYECIDCAPRRLIETGKLVRCSAHDIATEVPVSSSPTWSLLLLLAAANASEHTPPTAHNLYYIDPDLGDDSAVGTSPSEAWRTLAKLNAVSLKAGDEVRLKSGAQFEEQLYLGAQHTGTAENPVVITTDGSTPATIFAGDGSGVLVYDTGGIVLENLIVTGSGMATNTGSGFMFYTERPGRREGIVLRDVSASGFGEYGLYMSGYRDDEQLSGFSGLTVTRGVFFENELGGMLTWAHQLYGIENVHVNHSTFHSNPGRPNYANPSGSGVVLGRTNGGVIEYSVAYNNGAANTNSAGPVGIWAYDSNNVVIQHNLAYENRSGGGDGGGFDLDGGSTNSVLQYNFSYNNDGAGYLLAQYQGAPTFGGNVVRYNISQNDGRRKGYGGITLWAAQASNPVRDSDVYHNTVYISQADQGNAAAVRLFGGNFENVALRNNLLVADGVDAVDADVAVPSSAVTFQGNLYHRTDRATPTIRYGSAPYTSLASWRDASGQEAVSAEAVGLEKAPVWCHPPLPFEPTNIEELLAMPHYRLSGASPNVNAGLDLSEWGIDRGRKDFFGNTFADDQPDVGAHEFAAGDCAIVSRPSFEALP